jgi:hypothetical protein
MAENDFKNFTSKDGSGKPCVLSTLDCLVQERSVLFAIFDKCFFGGGKPCCDLNSDQHCSEKGRMCHTSSELIRLGHPVEILQWASAANTPQKILLLSSNSAHVRGGPSAGGMPRGSPSRRSSPIMWHSRTELATLMVDLVKSRCFAS